MGSANADRAAWAAQAIEAFQAAAGDQSGLDTSEAICAAWLPARWRPR